MAETSISKLQNQVIKLEKECTKLRDLLDERKEKQRAAEKSLKYYQNNLEKIVEEAVNKATTPLLEKIEKLEKENNHLKKVLNISSDNSGLPTSMTPIDKNKEFQIVDVKLTNQKVVKLGTLNTN